MRPQTPLEKDLEDTLYNLKVVLLLQCPDDATHFHQVLLDPKKFTEMTKTILGGKEGDVMAHPLIVQAVELEVLQSCYSEDEIDALEETCISEHDHE